MYDYEEMVLDPLSKTTERTFEPLQLWDDEYVLISTNDDGDKFICEPVELLGHVQDGDRMIVHEGRKYGVSNHVRGKLNGFFMRIPERMQRANGTWELGGTDFTVLVIHHGWDRKRIIWRTEEAKLLFDTLLMRFFASARRVEMIAQFKANGTLPELPEEYIEHPENPLSGYQKCALAAGMWANDYALFMDPGTGKTPICIARICAEARRKAKETGKLYRALVICPPHVRLNWEREVEKFATTPGKTCVLRGSKLNRSNRLIEVVRQEEDCEWSIAIISVDSVSRTWESLSIIPWDLIILDESHYIKSGWSLRGKFHLKFNQTPAKQKMILTGTPIANNIWDLWAQLEFLGKGLSGFTTDRAFKNFHCTFDKRISKGGTPVQKLIGLKGIPLLQERLARIAFSITKEEANLGLPDKVYDLEEVEMNPFQRETYTKLATQMIAEVEELIEDGQVSVTHILTKMLRLAQITSGFVKIDDARDPDTGDLLAKGATIQLGKENPKVEACKRMVMESENKTVIWCCFIEDLRALSQAFHDAGINHVSYHEVTHPDHKVRGVHEAMDVLNNDPDCKVFLGNPASAAEGLNLLGYNLQDPENSDTCVDHEIFYSCNWNMVQRQQAEDRAHRRGTRNPVRITDLVVAGTIDEEIRARLNSKKVKALMIQDVKEILERLL
jgi:SNF2 family DNA or RNA helicase